MKLNLEKITIRQFMDALQEELAGYDPDKTYIHFEVLSEVAVKLDPEFSIEDVFDTTDEDDKKKLTASGRIAQKDNIFYFEQASPFFEADDDKNRVVLSLVR